MNGQITSKYLSPTTLFQLQEALSASAGSRLLCGGTDLINQLQRHRTKAQTIIDVKKVPELRELSLNANELILGAAVTCAELAEASGVKEAYPGLVEAAQLIGSDQVQNRSSIGGNLCNASPAADTIAALLVNRAVCRISSLRGDRDLPVEDFLLGPGKTVLADDEVLVHLRIPGNQRNEGDAYLRMTPRSEMDIAIAGAAVKLTLDRNGVCVAAVVAISGVAERPLLVPAAANILIDTTLNEHSLQHFEDEVRAAANPITDKRGTREYRLHVVGVLARRAALIARERAAGRG